MNEPLGDAQKQAFSAVVESAARLIRRIDLGLASSSNLSLDLYDVLLALEDAPDHRLRMCELADRVIFSPSGLTRVIDRLEKEGYVRREQHPTDRRSLYAVLTESGIRAREAAWPQLRELIQEHFGQHLSRPQSEVVRDALKSLPVLSARC